MSENIQKWELQGTFVPTDVFDWEYEDERRDEEEMRDAYPEDCAYGGMYNPGSEYCDFVCSIGPCMTLSEYGEMMEEEARHERYLDRKQATGWRGKFWRGWYWIGSLHLRLPRLPSLESCEVCSHLYWDHSKYIFSPTCSKVCFDQWLPF